MELKMVHHEVQGSGLEALQQPGLYRYQKDELLVESLIARRASNAWYVPNADGGRTASTGKGSVWWETREGRWSLGKR